MTGILNRVKTHLKDTTDNILEFPRRLDELELKFKQIQQSIRELHKTLALLDDATMNKGDASQEARLKELELESWFRKVDRKIKLAQRDDVRNSKGDK